MDHTPYDTGSIMRLVIRRFGLATLPGIVQRDRALALHGEPPMGDLTNALDLTPLIRRRTSLAPAPDSYCGCAAAPGFCGIGMGAACLGLTLKISMLNVSRELPGMPGRGFGP